jgi:dTDP-4-dehydrorhamnose reductase
MNERVAWVTGAGGLIGSHLVRSSSQFATGWRVIPISRKELDLENYGSVTRAFEVQKPALILHCAALSRAAACQMDPDRAVRLNVLVTRHLCELAQAIPFIFFSTDLVFDGRKGRYVETDPVHPLSVYAETKAEAERLVLRNPRHTVLRVALNTGTSPTGDRSFTEDMRRAWGHGETLKLFTDEFRCPIPAIVTARAVWELVARNQPGLYHLGGGERLSRWEIGQLVAKRWRDLTARMEATSIRDFTGPPRPADTSLVCAKIQALLSFRLPGLTRWLEENPGEPV